MTLHWWMHWFWVTAQIVVTLTIPTITTTDQPTTADTTTTPLPISTTTSTATTTTAAITATTTMSSMVQSSMLEHTTAETLAKLQQSYRIAKAIGLQQQPPMNERSESLRMLVTTDSPRSLHVVSSAAPSLERMRSTPDATPNQTSPESNATETRTTQAGRIPGKKEAKITWIQAFSKPPRPKDKTGAPGPAAPSSEAPDEVLTVMPLKEDRERAKSLDPNAIRREPPPAHHQALPVANRSAIVTGSGGSREEVVEPRVAATAASILDAGIGDSTRLGRARGTFTNKFPHEELTRDEHQLQQQQQQQQLGKADDGDGETSRKESSGANVTEIATITGSCLAIVALLSTVGSVGFIMYRRRYLNPPQTLNSDKCSNPDSSGYIDDSTIRDNSEEMYSLDNDSFLNSLEAMTIQNYWTDSVKHTKL